MGTNVFDGASSAQSQPRFRNIILFGTRDPSLRPAFFPNQFKFNPPTKRVIPKSIHRKVIKESHHGRAYNIEEVTKTALGLGNRPWFLDRMGRFCSTDRMDGDCWTAWRYYRVRDRCIVNDAYRCKLRFPH